MCVRFSTALRLIGEYLLKKSLHRQSGKDVGKYEGSPALFQNFINLWSADGLITVNLNETALGLSTAHI